MPQNYCEPPTTTTNVYNYDLAGANVVADEVLSVAGGVTAVLANVPIADSTVSLSKNGIHLVQLVDYTIASDTITLTDAAVAGDVIVASYIKA